MTAVRRWLAKRNTKGVHRLHTSDLVQPFVLLRSNQWYCAHRKSTAQALGLIYFVLPRDSSISFTLSPTQHHFRTSSLLFAPQPSNSFHKLHTFLIIKLYDKQIKMLTMNMIITLVVGILVVLGQVAGKFSESSLTLHTSRLAVPVGLKQSIIN